MNITGLTRSEDATHALGRAIGGILRGGDIVALNGELGAGKTRLVRGIAAGLGIEVGLVNSPTFVIMNEYPRSAPAGRPDQPAVLVHLDAYRLRGVEDLDTIGWERISGAGFQLADPSGAGFQPAGFGAECAIVIEWAAKIAAALPAGPRRLDIHIDHLADEPGSRRFTLRAEEPWRFRPGWNTVERALEPEKAPGADPGPGSLPAGWPRCPVTGKPVSPDSPTFPFFDAKARLADLGRWFSGSYHVSRELVEEDMDDPDLTGAG